MKIIELDPKPPSMMALLEAVQDDDVLLVRAGHPLVRIEKFDDDDWEDWKYEHSANAIARGEIARLQYRKGEFRPMDRNGESDRLRKASESVRSLYRRYKAAIIEFEEHGGTLTCHATAKRGITFSVNGRRFAFFTIQKGNFKIWLKIKPGTLNDPKKLTTRTAIAHTISVHDDEHFDYIVGLIKQAYLKNK